MTVLVTGGLGFIGHQVVHRLENLGHQVIIVDTQSTYGIVPQQEIDFLVEQRKQYIKTDRIYSIDVSNESDIKWLVRHHRPQRVLHLASFPRQKVVNAHAARGSQVMSQGLLNLLDACVDNQVERFVYASSSMIYGDFKDTGAAGIDEMHSCRPLGQYGILKLAGEWLVRDYTVRTGMTHTIVRPSAVYGARDVEDRVVSKFLLAAMRDQTIQVRGSNELLDFTHVDDTAQGMVLALLSANSANKTYNISRGHSRTLLEAAELAVRIAGRGRIEVQDRDQAFPSRGQLNTSAAQQDLGYCPKIDIEQGFKYYYDWLANTVYWNQKTI
jgi:nucleoside-diphosphate-sugar epimerase